MKLTIDVLHNVSADMFFRYDPNSSLLFHAHTFEVEADDVTQALNLVWNLANVGDASELRTMFPHLSRYAGQVTAYRQRMNRSLSMSDVLIIREDGRLVVSVAIAMIGHETLDYLPAYAEGSNDTEVSASYVAHQQFRQ